LLVVNLDHFGPQLDNLGFQGRNLSLRRIELNRGRPPRSRHSREQYQYRQNVPNV
jgi:hypothetical protein